MFFTDELAHPTTIYCYLLPRQAAGYYTVSASPNKPVAQGSINGIVISSECSISQAVTLKAMINAAGYTGSFTYTVSFPSRTTEAIMELTPLNPSGTAVPAVDLYEHSGGANMATGTLILDTGYYNVVFTLKKDNQRLVWRELLHVYANLESKYTHGFADGLCR